jgi:hypothetical protein
MRILPRNIVAKALIVIFVLIGTLLLLNYLMSVKIANNFFGKKDSNSPTFLSSYKSFEVDYEGEKIKFYTIIHPSSDEYIVYIPSSFGASNSVLNSMALKYNLIIMDYPSNKKFQNFNALNTIVETALSSDFFKNINSKNIILFGHEIGANIALKIASKKRFKSVLLFNPLAGERDYCNSFFTFPLCLTVVSSFGLDVQTDNSIYYFYNNTPLVKLDLNYNMFNTIYASDKFLLEIPGDSLNFNFNHMLEFYLNENVIQNENLDYTNQSEEYEGEVKDIDGLLNPDEYLD